MLARMVGHVTYLSDDGMGTKFGRSFKTPQTEKTANFKFKLLHHQGSAFSKSFDANTYILMTKALDYFDPSATRRRLKQTFESAKCNFLVISFTSDWRFSVDRSREIVSALIAANKNVSSTEIIHKIVMIHSPSFRNILIPKSIHNADCKKELHEI